MPGQADRLGVYLGHPWHDGRFCKNGFQEGPGHLTVARNRCEHRRVIPLPKAWRGLLNDIPRSGVDRAKLLTLLEGFGRGKAGKTRHGGAEPCLILVLAERVHAPTLVERPVPPWLPQSHGSDVQVAALAPGAGLKLDDFCPPTVVAVPEA